MDIIYSHAVLTIVALSGLHANKTYRAYVRKSRRSLIGNYINPLASARLRQVDGNGWSWQFDIYRDLVGAYTRRESSYPSDIINPFSGVTGATKKCGSGPFICGIPERALHVGLLQVPATDRLTRR